MDKLFLAGRNSAVLAVQARMLLKWRWLVPAVSLLATAVFELAEGHRFDDIGFILELFSYGLIVPFLSWLLMTILAHSFTRRIESEGQFEQRRLFTQQIGQQQDWDEFTKFVTRFIGTFLPVSHVALYVYDHPNARLEFVHDWNSTGVMTIDSTAAPILCPTCPIQNTPRTLGPIQCQRAGEYCLPLICEHMLVGALRFQRRPGQALSEEQTEFTSAISAEIALAMALLIAYPRQIAAVQIDARLDERRRITYELHDSLAQQISYLHLNLDRITDDETVAQNPRLQTELERMRSVADDMYRRIRSTLALLRSQNVADLPQAIAEYAKSVSQRANLRVEFVVQGEPIEVSAEWRQNVYNLVRESLNNAEKHARAAHIRVDMIWSIAGVHLSVADDGQGFDTALPQSSGHYGLAFMSEKVAQMQGKLAIESSPGKGTCLKVTIPFPQKVTTK